MNNKYVRKYVIIFSCIAIFTVIVVCSYLSIRRYILISQESEIAFENQEKIVENIRECLKKHYIKIAINFDSQGEYIEDIEKIAREWVELAMQPTGVPTEGDYLRYQIGNYKISYTIDEKAFNSKYRIFIEPVYYLTLEQEEEANEKVDEILESLNISENSSDIEKINVIYDYIYDEINYDSIHKKNKFYQLDSTIYAALVYNNASCQGFSLVANRLLLEAGVDNKIITGYAQRDEENIEYHAWNLVKVDGLYYNMDITWDKQTETKDYFLKSNRTFYTHTRDEEFSTEEFIKRYPDAYKDY